MPRLAFWGDIKLPSELQYIAPEEARGLIQVHQGVDRTRALVVPTSGNYVEGLSVVCFWEPESDFSKAGFRAREMTVRNALVARSEYLYPLVWIEDDALSKTVGSYSSPTVTCSNHGFSNGDVVLIRRNGQDLYSLSAVSSVTANTFVAGANHAIASGDDIHLVNQVWYAVAYGGMGAISPAEHGDYYAEEVTYTFTGSGEVTYERTSITLD